MADTDDENRFTSRVARYARVGTAMSGLAARVAGERYLGLKLDRDRHARELREALGGLKGPLMKVAQLLSTIPDALPEEYVQELAHLQSNAPPMGWLFVKRRMASELGPDWESRFAQFDREPSAAASLGQVHRATAPDGTKLACKLQYPNMLAAVEADLAQLRVVMRIFQNMDRSIDTSQIQVEIADRLREELDYREESRRMAYHRAALADRAEIHVPEPVAALSTQRLLSMTWLDGEKITGWEKAPIEERNLLASRLFFAWYLPLYGYGSIHGDPHLGNYTVRREDLTINLLDFGCIRFFPAHFVGGVLDLYRALRDEDMDLAEHAYRTWGFTNLSREVLETLNIWARFVYAPVLQDRVARFEETNSGAYGRETAAKVHRKLRETQGGVRVPREFVFMDRAALGLGSVFLRLGAELNWFRLFHQITEGFTVEGLRERQAAMLPRFDLPVPA